MFLNGDRIVSKHCNMSVTTNKEFLDTIERLPIEMSSMYCYFMFILNVRVLYLYRKNSFQGSVPKWCQRNPTSTAPLFFHPVPSNTRLYLVNHKREEPDNNIYKSVLLYGRCIKKPKPILKLKNFLPLPFIFFSYLQKVCYFLCLR